jgi:hypothetical protein
MFTDSFRAFSYPNFADIRDGDDVFESVMAHTFAMVATRVTPLVALRSE